MFIGARDQIRTGISFEGYALSYSRPNTRSRPAVGLAGSACSPSRWQRVAILDFIDVHKVYRA
jgi:hypothetical protein